MPKVAKSSSAIVIRRGPNAKAPKQKANTNLPALIPVRKAKKLKTTKANLVKIGAKFSVPAKEISAMIEEGQVEKAVGFFQKKMLSATCSLIPIAEKQYKKNPSQSLAYAFNALVSQARELTQDLQSTGDRQKLALTLSQEVLVPAFRLLAQSIVDEHYALKRRIEDKLDPRSRAQASEMIDTAGEHIAMSARDIYTTVSTRINEMLVR